MVTKQMDLCSDGYVLYLDYINFSILGVALYYSFVGYQCWRKLGQGYTVSLCTVSCNCLRTYNYLKINILLLKVKQKMWQSEFCANSKKSSQEIFTVLYLETPTQTPWEQPRLACWKAENHKKRDKPSPLKPFCTHQLPANLQSTADT